MYVQDMQGPIDESTDDYLKKARENAENSGNTYELTAALDLLEEKVNTLREKGEKEGFTPWMLYDHTFNAFYGETPVNRQRLNAMIAMLFTVFLCAGITSYEKQAGVVPMLRSLQNGRRKLLLRKVMMALILSVFAWGCVYLREAHQFKELFLPKIWSAGEETVMREFLSAPIKNLDKYADFQYLHPGLPDPFEHPAAPDTVIAVLCGPVYFLFLSERTDVLSCEHSSPDPSSAFHSARGQLLQVDFPVDPGIGGGAPAGDGSRKRVVCASVCCLDNCRTWNPYMLQ